MYALKNAEQSNVTQGRRGATAHDAQECSQKRRQALETTCNCHDMCISYFVSRFKLTALVASLQCNNGQDHPLLQNASHPLSVNRYLRCSQQRVCRQMLQASSHAARTRPPKASARGSWQQLSCIWSCHLNGNLVAKHR